ncbi:MAG: hypothetical protein WCA22_03585 [Candidatus Binatus sp.]
MNRQSRARQSGGATAEQNPEHRAIADSQLGPLFGRLLCPDQASGAVETIELAGFHKPVSVETKGKPDRATGAELPIGILIRGVDTEIPVKMRS